MATKQELNEQYEKLLARQAVAKALMGMRTKTWKNECTKEELETVAATAAIKPLVLGKRVRGGGESASGESGE